MAARIQARNAIGVTLIGIGLWKVALVLCGSVWAHEAPSGWNYSAGCCKQKDCRQIKPSSVRESPQGYYLTFTGETIPYNDKRLRQAPDGLWHWCECSDCLKPTRCLYVPPRGM